MEPQTDVCPVTEVMAPLQEAGFSSILQLFYHSAVGPSSPASLCVLCVIFALFHASLLYCGCSEKKKTQRIVSFRVFAVFFEGLLYFF